MLKVLFAFLLFCSIENIESDPWKKVYLTTYPRSGNHWMRYLIEEVSGIATGSLYHDSGHEGQLHPWGGYLSKGGYEGTRRNPKIADTVVIKSHYPAAVGKIQPPSHRVIRIVRHPIDSIASWYIFSCERAGRAPVFPISSAFVKKGVQKWKAFQQYWNAQEKDEVFTYRFEDLLQSPFEYLQQTIDFIGYPSTSSDIQRAVGRYPPDAKSRAHLERYTPSQLCYLREELKPLLVQFGYEIP